MTLKETNRNLSMIEYFKRRASESEPRLRFAGSSQADFAAWKKELLGEVKVLLGPMPKPVPLNPTVIWEVKEDGLIKRRVMLDLEKDMSAAALIYIPEAAMEKPAPAIVCNHGHGPFGKDAVMGLNTPDNAELSVNIKHHNYDYGLQMARRGYVTIAIDWRVFGERNDGGNPYPERDACNVHFIRGSALGINLLALDIFDGMRVIDYLGELDCVDNERIGTMGLSFGGTMTTWLALMDERVKAADIICYSARVRSFAIGRGNFCGSQFVPGLFGICDVPDLHGLIAPRPLLAEIGAHDRCFLADESVSCCEEVRKIYAAAEAAGNYEVDLFPGGHQFAGNKAFGFFDRHLKG